jgi:hypothetical protein
VTTETLQEPEIHQTSSMNTEPQLSQPDKTKIPTSDQCDDIPSTNQEHHFSKSPAPTEIIDNDTLPPSPLTFGPIYKPLTVDELILPVDFALPILEALLKEAVNIDDDLETTSLNHSIDQSRIKIIPLKRKKPEPTIPFNRNHPFFNPISEPNLELLDIAISISLKKLKSMKEEVLIFPSDVDAEIREMEAKFSESLRLLGGYVKNKIQGRGMNALNQIMDAAEQSHAPRITNYNHEEECAYQEEVLAAIRENIQQAIEDAKKQEEEEAEKARVVAEA